MRPKLLSVVALTLAAVAATAARAETEPLAGSEWRPVEIEGVEVAEDVETFIRFGEDGKVEGNGGCNRFFGSVEIDGETLAFGPLAATKMLCPGPASETEDLPAHGPGRRVLRAVGLREQPPQEHVDHDPCPADPDQQHQSDPDHAHPHAQVPCEPGGHTPDDPPTNRPRQRRPRREGTGAHPSILTHRPVGPVVS